MALAYLIFTARVGHFVPLGSAAFCHVFVNPVCFLLGLLAYFRNFVEEKLGVKYTEGRKTEFAKSFRESGPASPVFFILSPGVDPLKDVESLGTKQLQTRANCMHILIYYYCVLTDSRYLRKVMLLF